MRHAPFPLLSPRRKQHLLLLREGWFILSIFWGLLQKIGRFGESDEFRRIGRISENPTFKRLREKEIRPILQIRPILGNVRFFVTGPRVHFEKVDRRLPSGQVGVYS